MEKRSSFENFKSNICHQVKNIGELEFIKENLLAKTVDKYYEKQWYPESFYILGMIDYLSRKNNIPLCGWYNKMRHEKLERIVCPTGIMCLYVTLNDEAILKESYENDIPEFKRFNIVENEVENIA